LAKLDPTSARRQLAYQMKANVPVALASAGIEVENGRHPLLDPKSVVPASLSVAPARRDTLAQTQAARRSQSSR
jgi:dsDNA-specific endonuclease/ATPase MutS2